MICKYINYFGIKGYAIIKKNKNGCQVYNGNRTAYDDEPFVYFFVARKAESELCEAYAEEIAEKLGIPTFNGSNLSYKGLSLKQM